MLYTRRRRSSTVFSMSLEAATATPILAGCGGGGSSSSDVVTSSVSQGTISGNPVKGPVSGSTVSAYA
jgi:hypothetical protein